MTNNQPDMWPLIRSLAVAQFALSVGGDHFHPALVVELRRAQFKWLMDRGITLSTADVVELGSVVEEGVHILLHEIFDTSFSAIGASVEEAENRVLAHTGQAEKPFTITEEGLQEMFAGIEELLQDKGDQK